MTGDGNERTRRAYLRAAATGGLAAGLTAGLSGCLSLGSGDEPGDGSPDATPAAADTDAPEASATVEPTPTASATPSPTPTPEPLARVSGTYAAYRGDAGRRAFVPETAGPADSAAVAYRRDLPGSAVQPVVAGPRCFMAGTDWLTAVDLRRGTTEWTLSLDARVEAPPVVAGERAFLATGDGLQSVAFDGSVAWRGTPTGIGAFAPTPVGDRFCAAGDGALALYADNGSQRWGVPLGGRPLATPAGTAKTVYVTTPRGANERVVLALTARRGDTDWRRTVSAQRGVPPVHADDRLFVARQFGGISAFDAETGDKEWGRDTPVDGPLAVTDDVVLAGADGELAAVPTDGGDPVWSTVLGGRIVGGPVADSEAVYVATGTADGGALHALDPADGGGRWTLSLGAPPSAAPAVVDGGLAVATGGDDGEGGQLVVVTE
ncbi:outer membrane protein assembly factor BamB family protein [Halosimplex salinum]|uniref:outer membrane protein assembly factor BamB family protein n=1 Tax=Halosimplex salinum TaxID=1710538 RepID=UPI0013DDD80F|nr:PQQ-binding-like beta-propeller repeat protein [Halosimplex salinum]